jgi:hypothetical protein
MNEVYRICQFDFSSFQKLENIDLPTKISYLVAQYLPKLLSESKSAVKYIFLVSLSMEISAQVESGIGEY